ncbi:MAG: hypothetical protein QNJ36_19085 [Calothrix sp. MO_167.B42]|nr:hypothetical protein [Calothrix sp. MO_167.B42]
MKKVFFQSGLLVMGIFGWGLYSCLQTNQVIAQHPVCSNYWTNPRTGSQECLNLGNSASNQVHKRRRFTETQNFNSTEPQSNYLLLSKRLISCHNQAQICDDSQRHQALYVTIKVKNITNKLVRSRVYLDVYSQKFNNALTTLEFTPVDNNANGYLKSGRSILLQSVLYNSYLPEGYQLRDLYFENLR